MVLAVGRSNPEQVFLFLISRVSVAVKQDLVDFQFRWTEADMDNDNELTKQEFLSYRHPETSKHALEHIANTIFEELGEYVHMYVCMCFLFCHPS